MPKKQKSGLYRTKIKIGVDAQGKDINKWVSGRTKAELETAKQEARAYYIAGTALRPDRLFGVYAPEWYHTRKEPRLSDSSRAGYRSMFNKHLLPAFGDRNLRAITALELQAWLNGLAGMSNTQITLAMTILRGIFGSAKSDRIIAEDPTVTLTMPEAGKAAVKRALTPEESGSLLGLIDALLHDSSREQDGVYLAILYYLGLRPGEARGLMWGDFDWNMMTVHVVRDVDYAKKGDHIGALKTPAAERDVPVPSELYTILRPRRGLPNVFVLRGKKSGMPLSKTSAECIWLRCMIDIGLARRRETPRNCHDLRAGWEPIITPSYLRHNYATLCWESGMDPLKAMRIIGHRDYRTTANIYTHLNASHIADARVEIESVFADRAKNKVALKLHKAPSTLRE